jgi:Dolichyl-phosphate-mannose-protein mannosyltransferase
MVGGARRLTRASGGTLAAILVVATLVRLALFLVAVGHPERFLTPDSPHYAALGRDFSEAYFGSDSGRLFDLSLLRTPGYSAFIAAVFAVSGDSVTAVIVVQLLLSLLTVFLVYLLAAQLFDTSTAAWAGFALAVDPVSVALANYLQSDPLFTLLLVTATLLWLRALRSAPPLWDAAAGFVLGMAILVRHIGLYLPLVLLPANWFLQRGRWTRRLASTSAMVLALALPVGGWIARNAVSTGVPLLSTGEGTNFLYYRAAGALVEDEGITLTQARSRLRAGLQNRLRPGMNDAEISVEARALGVEVLLDHPLGALRSSLKGVALMFIGPGRAELLRLVGDPTITEVDTAGNILLVGVAALINGAIVLGAAAGGYLLVRRRRYVELTIILSFVLYIVVISAGPEAYSRFRVPAVPFLAIAAGYAASSTFSRSRTREQDEERRVQGLPPGRP